MANGIRDKVAKMEQEMMDKTATHDPQIKSLEVSPSPSTATPCFALVGRPSDPQRKASAVRGCSAFDLPRSRLGRCYCPRVSTARLTRPSLPVRTSEAVQCEGAPQKIAGPQERIEARAAACVSAGSCKRLWCMLMFSSDEKSLPLRAGGCQVCPKGVSV
jgi:hypothetical protein